MLGYWDFLYIEDGMNFSQCVNILGSFERLAKGTPMGASVNNKQGQWTGGNDCVP